MKVLMVHPRFDFYGGDLLIVELVRYLKKHGIECSILTLKMIEEVRKDILEVPLILPKNPIGNKFNQIFVLRKMILENEKHFDVINTFNSPAEIACIGCKKPVVWTCFEPAEIFFTSNFKSKIIGKLIHISDKIFLKNKKNVACVADEANSDRFEKLFGIKPEIQYYGISYERFSNGNAELGRKLAGVRKEAFIVLQVGVLTPLKNQLESIKTVERLKERIPNIRLVLAGSTTKYKSVLNRYIYEHKLHEYVIFTGHLKHSDVSNLYAACNVALYPIKSQGGWLSPFEAICAEKPTVVSELATSSDIIRNNNLGVVTDNFSEAIFDIYENRNKYIINAKKGNVWVRENLTWDKFSEGMMRIFERSTQIQR